MLLYAGISLLCFFIALIAWRWAKRGKRIDDHPICRKCGYDMFGQHLAELPDCPECGTQIYSDRQLRRGNREPRVVTSRAMLSLALLALVASIGFTGKWAQTYDWNRVKPVSWLIHEASDPTQLSTMDAALTELERREEKNFLSFSQRIAILRAALSYQKDKTKAWDSRWGAFISRARVDGICSQTDWETYLSQAADFKLRIRERINEGDPFVLSGTFIKPFRHDPAINGINYGKEDALHTVRRVESNKVIDPPILQFRRHFGWFSKSLFANENSYGFDKLPPGEYELTVSTVLNGIEPHYDSGFHFPSEDEQFEVRPVDLKARFEVFSADVKLINAVQDPKSAKNIESQLAKRFGSWSATKFGYDQYQRQFYIEFSIPAPRIPYWSSYDMELLVNGEVIADDSSIVFEPTSTNHYTSSGFALWRYTNQDRPPPFNTFTLRLTPNPEHLKTEVDGYDYLDHVIEIKDIPVKPYQP